MTRSALNRYLLSLLYENDNQPVVRRGPFVSISRRYGAGAREIAPLLAKRLGVPLYDREIIEEIVRTVEGDPALMQRLDEAAPPGLVMRLLQNYGNVPSTGEYAQALVKIVLAISRKGGVVLGRGAHLIASAPDMYRVYLHAPPEFCIANLAQRHKLDRDAAEHEWRRTEEERRQYLKHYFGHSRDVFEDFDLAIDTGNIRPIERVVDIVVAGLAASDLLDTETPAR